jgi:glycosyltransferase involved in cell wall biosynthesis
MTSLSIIVASSGRPTLKRTIDSARSQIRDGDEILVSVQTDCPWGHAARNQLMPAARGDALCFIDDDDAYTPGALDVIRAAFEAAPSRLHLFKMRYADGRELWHDPRVYCGNVSTQMVVVPRKWVIFHSPLMGPPPQWGNRYEGDFDFIASCERQRGEPVFHEDVIALVRPDLQANL